jgi:dienelactone hydrolase
MTRLVGMASATARILLILALSPLCMAQIFRYETSVVPLPGEDIGSPCHYELSIPNSVRDVTMVWVIFDRGRDVHDLYSDEAVIAFARRFHVALLLHGHCPGTRPEDRNDMNMDPSKGLGGALSRAISQLAAISHHRELSARPLLLLGFSGAGPLCARLVALSPDRVLAAVLSSPGHYEPLGINTVDLNTEALQVPELIIAGSADNVSGTARPYQYFRRHRDRGAPWVFVVQNKSPHCCTANAKQLILTWLEAVLKLRHHKTSTPLAQLDQRAGWLAFLKTRRTTTIDSFGLSTFEVTAATIENVHSRTLALKSWETAGWLPNHAVAKEWLAFIRQSHHPILPLR